VKDKRTFVFFLSNVQLRLEQLHLTTNRVSNLTLQIGYATFAVELTQVAMTMQERLVTEAIAKRLKCEGVLSLQVRCGREHGPDREAQLHSSRRQLFIEANGDVKAPDSAIGVALYQILARYDGQAVCDIALPFSRKYQNLVRNILPGIQRMGLHVIFVKDAEEWHLSPNAGRFLPSKPASLVEALER
jgi:hypothetical protein